jgi:hypothetical protein
MEFLLLMTRETVAYETPASRATSTMVTGRPDMVLCKRLQATLSPHQAQVKPSCKRLQQEMPVLQ